MDAVTSVIKKWPQQLIGVGVQVVSAVIVMLAVYYASLYASNSDELVTLEAVPRQRQSVMVLEPVVKTNGGSSLAFVTTEDAHMYNTTDGYVNLFPSLNSQGGAQFTYTFWLSLTGDLDRTLFLRGDTTQADFKNSTDASIKFPASICPMVRVKATSAGDTTIYVHFNSLTEYNNVATFKVGNGSVFDMARQHLVTISVHEGGSYGEINGTVCKIFVDQTVEQHTFQDQTLKENSGKLYVLPTFATDSYPKATGAGSASMRSLMYHNYAFDLDDVRTLMSQQATGKEIPYIPSTNRDATSAMVTLQQTMG